MGELLPGFGKGLSADLANQIRLIGEMGKKAIEFVLYTGLEARDHTDQQYGERQCSLPDEGGGFKAGLVE